MAGAEHYLCMVVMAAQTEMACAAAAAAAGWPLYLQFCGFGAVPRAAAASSAEACWYC